MINLEVKQSSQKVVMLYSGEAKPAPEPSLETKATDKNPEISFWTSQSAGEAAPTPTDDTRQ